MSLLAQVEQEVLEKTVYKLDDLINSYGTACQNISRGFKTLIDAQNKQMAEALALMDDAPNQMSAVAAVLPPDLEPYPEPSIATPAAPPSDTDHLGCPQGECLGFPSMPSMKFPFGLPENPSEDIQNKFKEYTAKLKDMQDRFKTFSGNDLEEKAINAKKQLMGIPYKLPNIPKPGGGFTPGGMSLPKFNPSSMLHSMGEGIKAKIKGIFNAKMRSLIIGQLDCLKVKDPRYAIAEEIVRFEAMASRLTFNADGIPNVNLGPAGDAISGFASKMDGVNGLAKLSGSLKQSGNGATALTSTDPLSAFKKPF